MTARCSRCPSRSPRASYGLVGESACGKSTPAFAIVRHLPRNGRILNGSVRVDGRDLLAVSRAELREIRALDLDGLSGPGRALNPSIRIGRQIAEVFEVLGSQRKEAAERAEAMLRKVQIADPGSVMQRYPHHFRAACSNVSSSLWPSPLTRRFSSWTSPPPGSTPPSRPRCSSSSRTSGRSSGRASSSSHNLGVIAKMCDRVGVLYAGKLGRGGAPRGHSSTIPRHPYTVGLPALHPARRHAEGSGPARLHSRLSPAARRGARPAASSRTGARWPTTGAAPTRRR